MEGFKGVGWRRLGWWQGCAPTATLHCGEESTTCPARPPQIGVLVNNVGLSYDHAVYYDEARQRIWGTGGVWRGDYGSRVEGRGSRDMPREEPEAPTSRLAPLSVPQISDDLIDDLIAINVQATNKARWGGWGGRAGVEWVGWAEGGRQGARARPLGPRPGPAVISRAFSPAR